MVTQKKMYSVEELSHMRKFTFVAVCLTTVALCTSITVIPSVYSYVQKIESDLRVEMKFCESISRDLMVELLQSQIKYGQQTRFARTVGTLANQRSSVRILHDFNPSAIEAYRYRDTFLPLQPAFNPQSPPNALPVLSNGYGPQASPPSSVPFPNVNNPSYNQQIYPEYKLTGCCTCNVGPIGAPGYPGQDGKDGLDGLPGNDGIPGRDSPANISAYVPPMCTSSCPPAPSGPVGPKGPKGQLGQRGDPGSPSSVKVPGPTGLPGPVGNPGAVGANGHKGPPGNPGNLFLVEGPRGSPGPTGQAGPNGPNGPSGLPSNKPGAPGTLGEPGDIGDPGQPGKIGRPGPPGSRGPPGNVGDCSHCPKPRTSPGY